MRSGPCARLTRWVRPTSAAVATACLLAGAAGCARTPGVSSAEADTSNASGQPAAELRLGYFANVTHAAPVYGVATGDYAKALGSTRLKTQVFSAGPAAVEALFAGSLDAAYVGPNPAINAFVKSNGRAIRVVAGATSGGASLVVAPSITSPSMLRGRVVSSPQTGGTQDIALRTWLADQGFRVDLRGGGDVTIRAQENAQSLLQFASKQIAGAWVPEPWASRLVLEGGGSVLVNEADLWPTGRFVTTHLVVRTQYLRDHPQTIEALLRGQLGVDRAITADPVAAGDVVNTALESLSGKKLAPAILQRAMGQIQVTEDPLATSLRVSAAHAFATGLVATADLNGIYDLTLLRKVLGRDVDDAGLGGG
jgi:NitT/TauT family transport system substrate-binding protein